MSSQPSRGLERNKTGKVYENSLTVSVLQEEATAAGNLFYGRMHWEIFSHALKILLMLGPYRRMHE